MATRGKLTLFALILCACFYACGIPHVSHLTENSEKESVIAGTEPSDKALIEVTWPEDLIDMQRLEISIGDMVVYFREHEEKPAAVDDSDLYARVQFAEDEEAHSECMDSLIKRMHEHDDEGLFSAVTKNDEGTITVSMTAEEYTNSLSMLHNRLSDAIEASLDQTPFVDIEYEPDYSEIRFYAGNGAMSADTAEALTIWNNLFYVIHNTALLRLYESKDSGQASVRVQVFDHDAGKLLDETIVPGGELVLPLSFEGRSE